jgi:carbonic anhydrase
VFIEHDITKSAYGNFYNRKRDWVGSDTTVKIYQAESHKQTKGMYFKSDYGFKVLGAPGEFEVKEFHFHSKSEHTIEGTHFDLEMHIVHLPSADATV